MKKIALAMMMSAFAGVALAQDSVSNTGGLPGDGLDAYDPALQCVDYVVDLTPFFGSKGTPLNIGPVLKTSKSDPAFFGSQWSAHTLSRDIVDVQNSAAPGYAEWFVAGEGINPMENNQANVIPAPQGNLKQIAMSLAEFSGNLNGILGAVVNIDPAQPNRLWVKRVNAVTNGANSSEQNAAIGNGGITAFGDMTFRADSFQVAGPSPIGGQNLFNINLFARDCQTVNSLSFAGMSDVTAGVRPVDASGVIHNVPNITGDGILMGTNFNAEYVYGNVAPATSTGAHLQGINHRGAVAYMLQSGACFGGPNGTAAVLARPASNETTNIDVWGVEADGSITPGSGFTIALPASIEDKCDPNIVFSDTNGYAANVGSGHAGAFNGFRSQTAFRGGTSQVALQRDPFAADRLLVAATVYGDDSGGFQADPFNYIAVARIDCANQTPEWAVVAYSQEFLSFGPGITGDGKEICTAGGQVIGKMTTLDRVTGGSPVGPSISAPAIDAAGNVWFLAAVELTHFKDGTPRMMPDTDSALIRAIYNPSTLCYDLELVMELGEVFRGQNSDTEYQIGFLSIADSDSLASGTLFSANVSERAFLGSTPTTLLPTSAANWLGGLVVAAECVYDAEGDLDFEDPTGGAGNPASLDESYNSLLYIAGGREFICGDIDCNGSIDAFDIEPFILALLNPAQYAIDFPNCELAVADINGDGQVDSFDIEPFISVVLSQGANGCAW